MSNVYVSEGYGILINIFLTRFKIFVNKLVEVMYFEVNCRIIFEVCFIRINIFCFLLEVVYLEGTGMFF